MDDYDFFYYDDEDLKNMNLLYFYMLYNMFDFYLNGIYGIFDYENDCFN